MAISMNLVRDWEDIQISDFQRAMSNWGFESQALKRYLDASPTTNDWDKIRDDALVTWFNFQHRRIPHHPRNVVPNPSLVCPPEVSQGWAMLQQEVKMGADLTPRLSRKIEDADYNDGMLNDWGFYHFHLGTESDPRHPLLKQGTAIVLLAMVDEKQFYPVDFVQHGQWGDKGVLEKAISAFPEYFERFNLKGFTDIASPYADDHIVDFRNCGINSIIMINNKLYAPPGMGVTTAGTSIAATMMLVQKRQQWRKIETYLRENLQSQHISGEIRLIRGPSAEKPFQIELRKKWMDLPPRPEIV